MTMKRKGRIAVAAVVLATALAACGSDSKSTSGTGAAADGGTGCATSGKAIKLAVNPWTGSAVNAYVAQQVIECKLGVPVEIVKTDENASWVGLDDGTIDANLEIWPSGHAADYATYITEKQSVVDLGKLGPQAKIGWYVPKFVVDAHPELATWEGFKDPTLAKLFATSESGDEGQFTMGDPSYVTYDEQIIANLGLPLKYVVAGSEAALLTAIDKAEADQTPILVQFWQPHWRLLKGDLVQVTLPEITPECTASLSSQDGKYACDYPVDELYKAANAKLQTNSPKVYALLAALQLTTEQQSEIAGYIDRDGMSPDAAAKKWVDANADVIAAWLA